MQETILEDLGLSKNEIKVYFALLELDQASATPIRKGANIPNSKVYPVLDRLIARGLVSTIVKNNVKYFQASDPANLLQLLSEKEKSIEAQKKELKEKIIPEIELKRKLHEDTQEATVYESYEGIKAAFNFMLSKVPEGGSYDVFVVGDALSDESVIRFYRDYHKKRHAKKITIRLLAHETYREPLKKRHIYPGMEFRLTKHILPVGTYVFKGYTMTVLWKGKPTAFVIKSKQNYEYYKAFFDDMWQGSHAL